MLTSRKIDDLAFPAKLRALNALADCKAAGIDVIVVCTVRDREAQAALYAQGRTKPGRICTFAKPGESFHQYAVALDIVPVLHGKPVWDDNDGDDAATWERTGKIFEANGFEWAARWKHMRELGHFQFTGGLTIADFQAGKTIPEALWQPSKTVHV